MKAWQVFGMILETPWWWKSKRKKSHGGVPLSETLTFCSPQDRRTEDEEQDDEEEEEEDEEDDELSDDDDLLDPVHHVLDSKYWWPMSLFLFIFISQIGIETSIFNIQYFAGGLHGGVDVKWSGGLFVLDLLWRDCG
jgi:hypothetical protein